MYLVLCPHVEAFPAAYHASCATLADDLGWEMADFIKAFRHLARKGMVKADWDGKVVYLPGAIRHNAPENPNVCKAWAKAIAELPDSPLVTLAVQESVEYLGDKEERFPDTYLEAFREAFLKGYRKQEQEQQQEQDQEQDQTPGGNLTPLDALYGIKGSGPYVTFAPDCSCRGWGVRWRGGKFQKCGCGAWVARKADMDKGNKPPFPPKVGA